MLRTFKMKTQLLSAAAMTGLMMGSSEASAQTFNEYVSGASEQVTNFPQVVAFISYLGGFVLAALGVVGLKQHVENPSQNPMKNALAKLGFGGMLLALPPVVNALQGSGEGAGGGGATTFSAFDGVSGIGGGGGVAPTGPTGGGPF
jgi:hypothetical protein